jgi:RNA polymerase sigma-70 factor (ECF subfamily)
MSTRDEIEAWIRTHRDELVRTAQTVVRDRAEAEEVVQDTLLRVWKQADRGDILEGGAYLARATYWNALKHRARRREAQSLDAETESAAGPVRAEDPEWTLSVIELERAIADLPAVQQVAIRLKFYLGLSYQEIGATLSISANTAASRCRYALEALRRKLTARR